MKVALFGKYATFAESGTGGSMKKAFRKSRAAAKNGKKAPLKNHRASDL